MSLKCVNSLLKVFIFEPGKHLRKMQGTGQLKGAWSCTSPSSASDPAWHSKHDQHPRGVLYGCFRLTRPRPAPGFCLSLEGAVCTPLSRSRGKKQFSCPFFWSPLQPDQTLPSYLNSHKAPARPPEAGSHMTTMHLQPFYISFLKSTLKFAFLKFILNKFSFLQYFCIWDQIQPHHWCGSASLKGQGVKLSYV